MASGEARLHDLRDLYPNEDSPGLELDFMLERKATKGRDVNGTQRRVEIRTRHDGLPSSHYFLLGSVPISSDDEDDDGNDEDDDDEENDDEGESSELNYRLPNGPQHTPTISLIFCKCSSGLAEPPVIVQVKAWLPRSHYIYDIDDEVTVDVDAAIPDNFQASGNDLNVESPQLFGDLLEAFQLQRSARKLIPYDFSREKLTYRFYHISKAESGVTEFPKDTESSVPIAIRFVQHLDPNCRAMIRTNRQEHLFPVNENFANICAKALVNVEEMAGAKMLYGDPRNL